MPLAQGQVLNNRYRVVKLLGQGGFGAVYRAWDMNLSRPCAVKENLDASAEAQAQFSREALILANLNHPNLARVIDYFFVPGQGQYFVMDFVEGEDLQEMLDGAVSGQRSAFSGLPEEQVLPWISQICDALDYLHSQNPPIIHRDIKPANIKITPQGKAMLVDFGIAKIFDPNLKTTVGARAVTPGFAPPEQYGQGKTDNRTDIYALGATLYTLLTGQVPPESVEIMSGNAAPPPPVAAANPRISRTVSEAVSKAMALNRTERFHRVSELRAALSESAAPPREPMPHAAPIAIPTEMTLTTPDVAAPPIPAAPPRPSSPRRVPSARRALPWVGIFGGLAALVLCVGGIILLWSIWPRAATPTALPPAPTRTPTLTPTPLIPGETPTVVPPTRPPLPTDTLQPFTHLSLAADCSYGGELKFIETLDNFTVRFTLCYPDSAFAVKIALPVFAIQDREYLDQMGGSSQRLSEAPNGTGPFRFGEWVRGDHITFEANPDYWGAPPEIGTLVFQWEADSAARLLEVQSGNAQAMDNPAPDDYAAIIGDTNLGLITRPILNIGYLGFSNFQPPFDNELVRRAAAMAIDRDWMVNNFYPPASTVAEQFVPPEIQPGYTQGLQWYAYDPDAAKQLLVEAGYPNGFSTTLVYRNVVRSYLADPVSVAQYIQKQLEMVGIQVTLVEMDSAAFIEAASAGSLPMYLLGWGADYVDASNFYDYHFASEGNQQYGNPYPDLVEVIRAAGIEADPGKRQALYDEVNALIMEHVPMVPLAHGGSATVWDVNISGAHASPLGMELFAGISVPGQSSLTWVQSFEPMSLWCADESDGDTFRACAQLYEPLVAFGASDTTLHPALAERWETSSDLRVWTFHLRQGVYFHNGAALDSSDVFATFEALWNAASPNHTGNSGAFEYFLAYFGAFLNGP